METDVKKRYRLFQRGKVFYYEDIASGRQLSLKTKDKEEAYRLLAAMGDAQTQNSNINFRLAEVYLNASDPGYSTRTWQAVFDAIIPQNEGPTQERWLSAVKDQAFERSPSGGRETRSPRSFRRPLSIDIARRRGV